MVAPIIPGLNDEDMGEVLRAATDAGATRAGMVLLRLPGPVKDVFEERLRAALPLRADKVLRRIKETRGGKMYDARFGVRGHGRRARTRRPSSASSSRRARSSACATGMRDGEGDAPTTFQRPRGADSRSSEVRRRDDASRAVVVVGDLVVVVARRLAHDAPRAHLGRRADDAPGVAPGRRRTGPRTPRTADDGSSGGSTSASDEPRSAEGPPGPVRRVDREEEGTRQPEAGEAREGDEVEARRRVEGGLEAPEADARAGEGFVGAREETRRRTRRTGAARPSATGARPCARGRASTARALRSPRRRRRAHRA